MELEEIRAVVNECSHPEYSFVVQMDRRGAMYLQGGYYEPDVETGMRTWQVTRRWFVNPEMTRSEIVQTVFKCVITSMEHRCREWFRYKGEGVYGPHFDVEELHALCSARKFERRGE